MYTILILYLILWAFIVSKKKKTLYLNVPFNCDNKKIKNQNNLMILLVIFPLVLVYTFRDFEVGTDTQGIYHDIYYEGYGVNGWRVNFYELAFKYLVKFSYFLLPHYSFFLFVCSMLICGIFISYFVYKKDQFNVCIAFLSFFILIYAPSLNILRQILAVTICILGIEFLEKEDVKKSCILFFIACFFHITSIVMYTYIIMFLLRKNKSVRRFIPIICVIAPIIVVMCATKLVNVSIFSKFKDQVHSFDIGTINTKFLLFPLMVFPLVILNWDKLMRLRKYNYIHLSGYILIYSLIISSGFLWFAFRMMYFFIPSMIIIISQLGKCYKNKSNQMFVNLYIIICLIINFYVIYVFHDTDGIYPYKFIK